MDVIRKQMAGRLKVWREAKSWSQDELAMMLSVTKGTVSYYEKVGPPIDMVPQLVQIFGKTYEEFFTGAPLNPKTVAGGEGGLSLDEAQLVASYRSADAAGRLILMSTALKATLAKLDHS